MSEHLSHRFTHAIVRMPGDSVARGLRADGGPDPDAEAFRREHAGYVTALGSAGVSITVLQPLEAFPDSVFVEDTALCLPMGAILLRPGAESRRDEVPAIGPEIARQFDDVRELKGPGVVDGGDIMVTGREAIVGLSARTDETGFAELKTILDDWGLAVRLARTPPGILHFKTAGAVLGEDTVLCTPAMAVSGVFDGYRTILTAPGEEAAANAIRVNDTVFVAAGFPRTVQAIATALPELTVTPLPVTQAALVDGGLSCLSLRFLRDG